MAKAPKLREIIPRRGKDSRVLKSSCRDSRERLETLENTNNPPRVPPDVQHLGFLIIQIAGEN